MDKVLIIGVESIAGANLAAVFAPGFNTVGLTAASAVRIENCRVEQISRHDPATLTKCMQAEQPDQVVFCGRASRSSWDCDHADALDDQLAVAWASVARQYGASFTLISSDAVFTGPWMSHHEDDTHYCDTPQAALIRQVEADVKQACPEALVVRTNVFGWSASQATPGFAESLMKSLVDGLTGELDSLRHAAPMLASDLAVVLLKAWESSQSGTLHVAGSERINPCQFAERLAAIAELSVPDFKQHARLTRPVTGFGRGETMLDCRRARRLLNVSMPLIDEGITRMLEQTGNGYLDQLRCTTPATATAATRVA